MQKSSASSGRSGLGKRQPQNVDSDSEDEHALTLPRKRARTNSPPTPSTSHTPEILDLTMSSLCSIQSISREDFETAKQVEVNQNDDESDEEVSALTLVNQALN